MKDPESIKDDMCFRCVHKKCVIRDCLDNYYNSARFWAAIDNTVTADCLNGIWELLEARKAIGCCDTCIQ